MKVLGIRVTPQVARYAIVDYDDGVAIFINHDSENRLDFPAALSTIAEKSRWLYMELDRIFPQYPDLEQIIVKENEYGGETKKRRESTYLLGVVFLIAAQRNISSRPVLYTQLKTNGGHVKEFAETNIGRSSQYWDTQIADAVAATWIAKGG
jgi:hypothetical protein